MGNYGSHIQRLNLESRTNPGQREWFQLVSYEDLA